MNLKLALRNVFRNRRRTLFSLLVIGVGVTLLSFVLGFVAEALRSTERSLALELGALQVGDARVLEGRASGLEALISPSDLDKVVGLVRTVEGSRISPQLNFAGLIGNEKGSTLLLARGVVPEDCMADYVCMLVAGRPLAEREAREVVLGERLAGKLNLRPGDTVNVAAGTVNGTLNASTVTVVGTLRLSNAQLEERFALVPLGFAQRLVRTTGVERVLIWIEDLAEAPQVRTQLEQRLKDAGLSFSVRTWQDLSPFFESIGTFWRAFSGLTSLAIFVLVFFSVLEVLTISFLERTREVATVRALGVPWSRVFGNFVLEGMAVGFLGGLAGVMGGIFLGLVFNALGLTFVPPGGTMPQPIRVAVGLQTLVVPFLLALLATAASSVYPGWKNARLNVAEALRAV